MNRTVKCIRERLCAVTRRQWLALLVPVSVLLTLTAVLYAVFGRKLLIIIEDPQAFKVWIDGFGVWGEAAFVGIRTAQTVFKFIPAEPLEVGSGYAFGVWGGLFLCMLGTELGSAVILLLSKRYGMRFVSRFTDPEKLREFSFLQDNRKLRPLLFLIYFIPGAPKDLLTYFIAFTDIRLWEYLLITAFARIPSIITSTMCGAYFGEKRYLAAVLVYALTALLSVAGVFVYRRIAIGNTAGTDEKIRSSDREDPSTESGFHQ